MEPTFFGVRVDQYVDLIQTIAILIALVFVSAAYRALDNERSHNEDRLTEVLKAQQEVQAGLERAWKRIDDIETRQGIRGDVDHIAQLHRVIDAMQVALRVSPNDNKK